MMTVSAVDEMLERYWKRRTRKTYLGGVGKQEVDRAAAGVVTATQHRYADPTLIIGQRNSHRSALQQTGRNLDG